MDALASEGGLWKGSMAALGRHAGAGDTALCRRAIKALEGAGVVELHRAGSKVVGVELVADDPAGRSAEDLVRERTEDLNLARTAMLQGLNDPDVSKAAAASRELRLLHQALASLKVPEVSKTDELADRRRKRRTEVQLRSTGRE